MTAADQARECLLLGFISPVRETCTTRPKSSPNKVTRMRNSRYVLTWILGLALVFPSLPVNAGDAVPLLIWGGGEVNGSPSISVNPLQKTSQAEYEKIVTEKLGGSGRPVLYFLREYLCVEDFGQHKEGLMHLADDGSLVYLPAVKSPLSFLENLPNYNVTWEDELESVSDYQVVITPAGDLDAVSETYNMVKESSPNLVAALTGKSCPFSKSERVRRVAETPATETPKANDEVPIVRTERILLYLGADPVLNMTDRDVSISTHTVVDVKQTGEGTVKAPLTLDFVFAITNNTNAANATISLEFGMNSVTYYTAQAYYVENDKRTKLTPLNHFVFPYNVSYHCSANVRFYQKKIEDKQMGIDFVLSNFQVQIDPKNSTFDYPVDCVGFTSVPIWSGIFVTLILGLIMIWGLTMIMDIRTMDRFDDPKGKTITVTASE